MENPAWYVLVYVILPIWILAAFADYLCHRASDIEHTSGIKENVLHWLLFAEAGFGIGVALFFTVNALVIAFLIVLIAVHAATVQVDLRLAMRTRTITPIEQQVHSVLDMMPVAATMMLAIMHWAQAQALFGFGDEAASFALTLKEPPGWNELAWPAAGFLVFGIAPYAEELWRGWRARR
jgi:hypothetical protein